MTETKKRKKKVSKKESKQSQKQSLVVNINTDKKTRKKRTSKNVLLGVPSREQVYKNAIMNRPNIVNMAPIDNNELIQEMRNVFSKTINTSQHTPVQATTQIIDNINKKSRDLVAQVNQEIMQDKAEQKVVNKALNIPKPRQAGWGINTAIPTIPVGIPPNPENEAALMIQNVLRGHKGREVYRQVDFDEFLNTDMAAAMAQAKNKGSGNVVFNMSGNTPIRNSVTEIKSPAKVIIPKRGRPLKISQGIVQSDQQDYKLYSDATPPPTPIKSKQFRLKPSVPSMRQVEGLKNSGLSPDMRTIQGKQLLKKNIISTII